MDPYQQLGQALHRECSSDFVSATIEAEIDDDWAQIKVACTRAGGEKQEVVPSAQAVADMHESLDEIWNAMAVATGHRWKRCIYTLERDGSFNFNVEY